MNEPVPAQSQNGFGLLNSLLVMGSIGLIAWSGVYLGHYGGRFDGNEFDPIPSKRVVSAGPVGPPDSPEVKKGRILYAANCAACHGTQGQGEGTPGVPPLDGSEWVTAAGPGRLIRILANAVDGPIKVKTKDYNNVGMLAWRADKGGVLSPEDSAAVLTFIRQAWSNKAGPVTTNQISAVWEETKAKEGKWTVPDLEKVPEASGGGAAMAELTLEQLHDKLKALPPDTLKELLKDLTK